MSWAIGYDDRWQRDVGYGVPAVCDHPKCGKLIHRGLAHVCGGDVYGGAHGCGLFFCEQHLMIRGEADLPPRCFRCTNAQEPFNPKPDTQEWVRHKLTDASWRDWRHENDDKVEAMTKCLQEGECLP